MISHKNPWKINTPHKTSNKKSKNSDKDKNNENNSKSTLGKFEKIQKQHLEKAKEFVENYNPSSDEDDLDSTDILSMFLNFLFNFICNFFFSQILDGLFQKYSGERSQLSKTQSFLENFLQSGSAICLICIGSIKRNDAVSNSYYLFIFEEKITFIFRFGHVKVVTVFSI